MWVRERMRGGSNKRRRDRVEKAEPVGVKVTVLAKSKGRKIPKKDRRVIKATMAALV